MAVCCSRISFVCPFVSLSCTLRLDNFLLIQRFLFSQYRSASFFRLFLEKTKEKVIRYPGGVRFLLAVNTGAAFWHAASFLPVPTVYPKTEFKGHLERTPVPDPRTEIIFCNNGKIPLIIQSFHFEQNGKKIDLATIKDPLFEYSGEKCKFSSCTLP